MLCKMSLRILLLACFIVPNLATAAETVWLDSLDLSSMEQGWGSPQLKRSVTKSPLVISGRSFERGVGTHSVSTYALDLAGGSEKFQATVGLDDSAAGKGSVVFQVIADGKTLFNSGVMRSGSTPMRVDVDLAGVRKVVLTVGDGGDGYQFDHADWADARFIVTGAHPEPSGSGMVDPIAQLKIPGKSAQRMATPVSLPFERTLPGPVTDWALMAVDGQGHREYYLKFFNLDSTGYRYAQRRGRASNGMKPMWVLVNTRTGKGLALMLAYMGNWTFEVEPKEGKTVVRLATTPAKLPPFMKVKGLPVPGALIAEFTGHWDYGTQPLVRFIREKLLREQGPEWPPVQYNTWYDLYDKLSQERLVDAAKVAKEAGCELFTIDAGWFGEGMDARWSETLGDWQVNRTRLPAGLEAVSSAVHNLGMKFGLWFEIECAAPSSRLAKEHPDWFLTDYQGVRLSKRSMLDFGKSEVLAHAKRVLDDAIRNYKLDYIKMDFNTDPAIENDALSPKNDPLYRHYKGMADLWLHLRATHPGLIVEDCSSGARRHELTSAALTDTHWISDTIDNQPNLLIMLGATYFFPATTCSHWTTKPDPKDRMLDLDAQFVVNMMGDMGLSGAIASWDQQTISIARERIVQYKRIRPLLRTADVFHLTTPALGKAQAALYHDSSSGKALLFAFHGGDKDLTQTFSLRGLEPSAEYQLSIPVGHRGMVALEGVQAGRKLIEQGLTLLFPHSGAAALIEINRVRKR
jgi:alpha-galactosidase